MGLVKNITGEALEVTLIGRVVDAGEEIEVDDSLLDPAAHIWPAATWLVNGASHEAPVIPAPVEPVTAQEIPNA